MLITNPITRTIITGIIAPHGITDLVHAKENKLLPELYTMNIVSVLGTFALDTNAKIILDILFYTSACYHFRNDMPKIPEIGNQTVLSALMLLAFLTFEPSLFLYYMIFIHVPNHYLMNWSLLSKHKKYSIIVIALTTMISIIAGETSGIMESHMVETISKGLIISHILYEETYIFKSLPFIENNSTGL